MFIYTHTHTYIHMYIYIYIYVRVYICTYMYICIKTYIYIYTYVCICICITYIHFICTATEIFGASSWRRKYVTLYCNFPLFLFWVNQVYISYTQIRLFFGCTRDDESNIPSQLMHIYKLVY